MVELYLRENDGDIRKNVRLFKNKSIEELSNVVFNCDMGTEIMVYNDKPKKDGVYYLLFVTNANNDDIYYLLHINENGNLHFSCKATSNLVVKMLYDNLGNGTKVKVLKELGKKVYKIVLHHPETGPKDITITKYTGTYYDTVERKSFCLMPAIMYINNLLSNDAYKGCKFCIVNRSGNTIFEVVKT